MLNVPCPVSNVPVKPPNETRGRSPLVLGFNHGTHPSACREFTGYLCVERLACRDDVSKDLVNGVLVKDSKSSVGLDVHLERFELEAKFVRAIVDRNGSEIRQSRLGAHRGVLRVRYANVVIRKLIRPALDGGQGG